MEDYADLIFDLMHRVTTPTLPVVPWPYWLKLFPELRSEIRDRMGLAERACLVRTSTGMRAEDMTVDLSFPVGWRRDIEQMALDSRRAIAEDSVCRHTARDRLVHLD